ncbi:alkaline phosphatase family protein [Trinickia sp. YCB016]
MKALNNVEHFIVLMLENRSFDHVLGFMRTPEYPIDGLQGHESNPADPNDASSPRYTVSSDADYGDPPADPGHSFNPASITQMFGLGKEARQKLEWLPDMPPTNNGFVHDYQQRIHGRPEDIMKCFAPERLPVLTTLAREFAVCDKWFSSAPGATCPNRRFVHAATSDGYLGGTQTVTGSRTIFELLKKRGLSGAVYYHDVPQSLTMLSVLANAPFKPVDKLWVDLEKGTLPNYAFIEPRYFNQRGLRANDQHPSNDMLEGEKLIASVYNAVRNSPLWEKTALVITYDEAGGTYDHASSPHTVNPDGKIGQDDDEDSKFIKFKFDRLGFRVPAVVVSPLIPRTTIDSRVHDHTAILALIEKRFGLPHLTERDKWAGENNLATLFSLTQARTDTPTKVTPAASTEMPPRAQTSSLNDLQFELVESAEWLVEHDAALAQLRQRAIAARNQVDAVNYLREVLLRMDIQAED